MSLYKLTKNLISEDLCINIQNLTNIDKKQKNLFKSRIALVHELAYTICKGGQATLEEIRENYLSALPVECTKEVENLEKYFNAISIAEKIELCKEISSLIDNKDVIYESILGHPENYKADATKKIAYVKNPFTDSAYLVFSGSSPEFRYAYFDSFDATCENVHSGESEFCILPIETSNDGKLLSFYSMIDKYELKIMSTCTVNHQEDSKFTKFALLGRSISLPQKSNTLGKKLELRISQAPNKESPIYEILLAAYNCNIQLCRIDSLPLSYNESKLSYYAVFDMHDAELKAFITYLSLEHPQCYALGIYSEN